jgi:esterase/lipase superfamily enzyme
MSALYREYSKRRSQFLEREMEMLRFGRSGQPWIVFPTSMGRFYDYEDRGMIAEVSGRIETGTIQLFCVDSVDSESWYHEAVHPALRAARHAQYDQYLAGEVVPFIHECSPAGRISVTGCSFGGYHSINFALRYPWLVNGAVSMGGAFDIHRFIDGYYDDNCYFHCPPDFLPGLEDSRYLDAYREMRIVLATGENDLCLAENQRLSEILSRKGVPHHLDIWGDGAGHDWPWWRGMARKFIF